MKCVIFDMDMTLIDSGLVHIEAFEDVLRKEGYKFNKIKFTQGWSNSELLKVNFRGITKKEIDDLTIKKQKVFIKSYLHKIKITPHAKKVLEELKKKGLKVCLFTQESVIENKALMNLVGFSDFDVVINASKVKKLKPNPEGIIKIGKKLGVKKEDMVFIGDSSHDLEAAKRGGIKFILMHKYYRIKEWKEADYHITDLREVLKVV